MKKLLPIVVLGFLCTLFYVSCEEPDNTPTNDSTYTKIYNYKVYIDNQNNITRFYQYDSTTNQLVSFTRYTPLNDSTFSICKFNADSSIITDRIYRLDANHLTKYSFLQTNTIPNLADTIWYEYDSLNYVSKVTVGGNEIEAEWNNAGNLTDFSNAAFFAYSSLPFKVDLFSPAHIGNDNKLTGNNTSNIVSQFYVPIGQPNQGTSTVFLHQFLSDSSGYVKVMFDKKSDAGEPVSGQLNYYTYTVE